MKYLFTREGERALEAYCGQGTLFAFDFDGTLAPIVTRPDRARLRAPTARRLKRLDGLAPVVLITGRSRADLTARLSVHPRYLVGNHGVEGISLKPGSLERAAAAVARWRESLPPLEGVELEDKTFSLSLHFRRARSREAARRRILAAARGLVPAPRLIPGKAVVNLVPPGAPHKGTALKAVLRAARCRRALYAGDDHTDEDVFRLEDPRMLTIRVGRGPSAARFYVKEQREMDRVLDRILELLQRSR